MKNQSCQLSISGSRLMLEKIQEKLSDNHAITVKSFFQEEDKKTEETVLNISVLEPMQARQALHMISDIL